MGKRDDKSCRAELWAQCSPTQQELNLSWQRLLSAPAANQPRDTHSWDFIRSRAGVSSRQVHEPLQVPPQPRQLLIHEKLPEGATLQQGIHLLPPALAQLPVSTHTLLFLLPLLLVYVQSRERCSSLAGVEVPCPGSLPTSSSPEDLREDLPSTGPFPKSLIGVAVLAGTL